MNEQKSFLEHVAEDIIAKNGTNLARVAVVFPNKRASLFLNDHLARLAGKPMWSPAYTTISDLFQRHATCRLADPVKLVCDLHKAFTRQTGIDETLDHFWGWGQLLLADFDDIDKQMADADRVLANLTDLHEMDHMDYLTDEQRQVLRRFFANFTEQSPTELKQRFIRLWSRLADIYHDFNDTLRSQQLAYEGALCREVAARDDVDFHYDRYLFVGFNVLSRVEQRLFTTLMRQGKARFYWDFDRSYIKGSEAGLYIAQNMEHFPNELDSASDAVYNAGARPKRVQIVSATTENMQARYAADWLRQGERIAHGRRTAIVLCNEGLLPTVTHCLPDEVERVNVTTGYPLGQSPVASLIALLVALRREGYDHQQEHFRLRQASALLRHPYVASLSPSVGELLSQLTADHNYFPTPAQLSPTELLQLLFRPAGPVYSNTEMLGWLADVLKAVAHGTDDSADALRQESLFRAYTIVNRLLGLAAAGDLVTDIVTLGRLLTQLMQGSTVPFHGEPAEGLQVMGLLETRNLDFDHVLMLSASEGNMPRGTADTSFIPYALRKAYGLTTQDHQVAIYSYYFNRLLQRATDVTIVYNNATTDGQKGEMSRFILQLIVESRHPVEFLTLQGGQALPPRGPQPVDNAATLPPMLSPTAINRYMRCPLQFHYHYTCGLLEPDETDDDSIDNRIFGNIFHEASRIVYTRLMERGGRIMPGDIDQALKAEADIERAVDEAFRKELFRLQPDQRPHFRPRLNGLQLINREVIIHYLRQLLTVDRQLAPFTILDLEGLVTMQIPATIGGQPTAVTVGGRIDRLDMVTDAQGRDHIRVIDYKTGAHRLRPLADVDAIFLQDSLANHSDYYLQTMLYSLIVAQQHPETPVSPALLFIQHAGVADYDPVLSFGKEPISDVRPHAQAFMAHLTDTIEMMYARDTQLSPTPDRQRCKTCPYRQLCY